SVTAQRSRACRLPSTPPSRSGVVEGGRLVRSANVGIAGVDLRADLVAATGLPVEVVNDAQAAALAEVRTGGAGTRGVVLVVTVRSEEHTSELQSRENLVCRLL